MEKEKPSRTALNPKRVFVYSYITSLAVAFIVVVIWLVVLFNYSSLPQSQLRTSPPDILELVFLCVTTLPSVLACLLFRFCYCSVFKIPEERKLWPAVLFGALSGLVFNAMTAIMVIEHFFDW
jgi:uncharacterized BrkB/YihY/UPF0761 family membrane protein